MPLIETRPMVINYIYFHYNELLFTVLIQELEFAASYFGELRQ